MAYGQAMRQRVLAFYDQGLPTLVIARRLCVSPAWCRRVKQRRDEPPRTISGRPFKIDAAAREELARWLAAQPDLTLQELRVRLGSERGVAVSVGALWNTLRRMKLSLKKSR
jgi:transposase